MKNKKKHLAIFLDRDGVVSRDVNYLSSAEQMELIPGAAEAIKLINQSDFLAIVVTNQSAIARKLCDLKDLQKIHEKLEALLRDEGAYLDSIYFCPHLPENECPEGNADFLIKCVCRKPKPGMILKAASEWDVDLQNSYLIGDKISDIQAGNAANLKQSILIETNTANALLATVRQILK